MYLTPQNTLVTTKQHIGNYGPRALRQRRKCRTHQKTYLHLILEFWWIVGFYLLTAIQSQWSTSREGVHKKKCIRKRGINSNEGLIPMTAHNGDVPPYLSPAAVGLAEQRRLSSTGEILLVCMQWYYSLSAIDNTEETIMLQNMLVCSCAASRDTT